MTQQPIAIEPDNSLLEVLTKELDAREDAAILCESKKNNPNYLSIIHANKKFCDIFSYELFNLVGKNYDFLFADFDADYYSEDQIEYVRLIKSVKDFHPCSILINLPIKNSEEPKRLKFKVNFSPLKSAPHELTHCAVFTFEKIEIANEVFVNEKPKNNIILLQNLERKLRSESLLREVAYSIISDLPIKDIARNIAKMISEYLKIDRCIVHDYQDGVTNFVVEFYDKNIKQIVNDDNFELLMDYISFQNEFYEEFGAKARRSSVAACDNIANDENFSKIRNICEKFSIGAQISITTTFNGKVNGGIYIHQSEPRTWLADELEMLEVIADQFSIAIDRSVSIEKVMVSNHALMEKTMQLKEALKQEQKMRKMQNEFVALVSHEFKTPLQIIDSTRELLVRKLKSLAISDEGVEKSLERIKSGIQRMNGLIHSTLNLARMEEGENNIKVERENFDLRKFISDIIEKNSNLAVNKNIEIVTKINELPQEFFGDAKLLDHAFTNIISNAIKYSRNNTTVKILAKANDKKVAIRVIDQGIGIPKEDLQNIGQKFFRAKNTLSVAGTGIGLYLTKHFINLHEGDVVIESEMNVGTSVTVTLPRKS